MEHENLTLREQGCIFDAELMKRGVKVHPYARILIRRRKDYQPEPEPPEDAEVIDVDLEPCPFCGGMPEVTFTELIPKTKNCRIYCPTCGLEHWHSLPLEENAARWNRRTHEE